MKTIFALFNTYEEADSALLALEILGVTPKDISVVAKEEVLHRNDASETTKSAGQGAGIGGLIGLIAGIASVAIPGIGPVIGAGTITGGLVGGAGVGSIAGGIVGFFKETFGTEENYGQTIEEGIKEGKILVAARAAQETSEEVKNIMQANNAQNLHEHNG